MYQLLSHINVYLVRWIARSRTAAAQEEVHGVLTKDR
jgi:hypothetical protein